jgi:polysaccharide export outer membrane protein
MISNISRFFLLLLAASLAVASAQAQGPAPAEDPPPAVIPETPAKDDASYILRPNDLIRLDVYQEPDLSGAVRILKTGEASFPLIGSVKLAGISVAAAAEKIRALFAADYLVDPKLTLSVQDYATEYISVIGAVRTPGQIPIPVAGNIDLGAAMATVGGLADTADANSIDLVRADGSKATYSYSSIINGPNGRTQLRAGDRIIVKQSQFVGKTVTVLGQVGRQGPIAFPLNGRLDLVTAIAAAGGLGPLAQPKKVSINRGGNVITVDYREISERANQPYLLQPGDIITVPERIF